jgi:peptidoglycan LD-endopeptidase LytH
MSELTTLLTRLSARSPLPFTLNARRCLRLDLSAANPALHGFDPADTRRFSAWVRVQIAEAGADYAAGGYGENRALYAMSPVFGAARDEPRTLHLGLDLWCEAGTTVHSVLEGTVHSIADNAAFGDYGPTVIMQHSFEEQRFYILYGHLSRPTLRQLRAGQHLAAGERIGWLGAEDENVGWPPHLHVQIIRDLEGRRGDYPGVCRMSERDTWLARCPDPNLLLRIDALRGA